MASPVPVLTSGSRPDFGKIALQTMQMYNRKQLLEQQRDKNTLARYKQKATDLASMVGNIKMENMQGKWADMQTEIFNKGMNEIYALNTRNKNLIYVDTPESRSEYMRNSTRIKYLEGLPKILANAVSGFESKLKDLNDGIKSGKWDDKLNIDKVAELTNIVQGQNYKYNYTTDKIEYKTSDGETKSQTFGEFSVNPFGIGQFIPNVDIDKRLKYDVSRLGSGTYQAVGANGNMITTKQLRVNNTNEWAKAKNVLKQEISDNIYLREKIVLDYRSVDQYLNHVRNVARIKTDYSQTQTKITVPKATPEERADSYWDNYSTEKLPENYKYDEKGNYGTLTLSNHLAVPKVSVNISGNYIIPLFSAKIGTADDPEKVSKYKTIETGAEFNFMTKSYATMDNIYDGEGEFNITIATKNDKGEIIRTNTFTAKHGSVLPEQLFEDNDKFDITVENKDGDEVDIKTLTDNITSENVIIGSIDYGGGYTLPVAIPMVDKNNAAIKAIDLAVNDKFKTGEFKGVKPLDEFKKRVDGVDENTKDTSVEGIDAVMALKPKKGDKIPTDNLPFDAFTIRNTTLRLSSIISKINAGEGTWSDLENLLNDNNIVINK